MTAIALRPDPGTPVVPDATTAPGTDAAAQTSPWIQIADAIPAYVWIAVAALVLIAITIVIKALRRNRSKNKGGGFLDKAMTFFAAAVATGVVGTGMWAFFGDTLKVTDVYLRSALFAFFELGMLAEALRSRRFRLDRAARRADTPDAVDDEVDVDGIAVWILALLSGVLASTHETNPGAIGLRLVAPIIAAWLWERGIAGELRQFRRTKRRRINWTISPERVLARLGLAEASARDINDVDRARRIARFARTVYRLHRLQSAGAHPLRLAYAEWQQRRQLIALNERLNLATDRSVMADVRMHLATLYQAHEGVAPAAVRSLSPWDVRREPVRVPATTGQQSDSDIVDGRDADTAPGALPGGATGTVPAGWPGDAVDIVTGVAPDISPDANPAPNPGGGRTRNPGTAVVRTTAAKRAGGRPSGRTRKPSPAQLKAERIRAKDPDITWKDLAEKVGVDERTCRRWFGPKVTEFEGTSELEMRPDVVLPLPAPTPPVMSGTNGYRHRTASEESDD